MGRCEVLGSSLFMKLLENVDNVDITDKYYS